MHNLERKNFVQSVDELKSLFAGKVITKASSSLNKFAVEVGDSAFLIESVSREDAHEAFIEASSLKTSELSNLQEAVCAVDWSWIEGSAVEEVKLSEKSIRFQLNPAGPLLVSAGTWQGKPFLSFQPYKAAAKN